MNLWIYNGFCASTKLHINPLKVHAKYLLNIVTFNRGGVIKS